MALYQTLGKGLLSLFFSLTGILSPSPAPKYVETIPPPIETIEISIPDYIETISTKTKQKYIPIYLNYPEKVSILPVKSLDYNFKKIFQYSIEAPAITPKIQVPTINIPNIDLPVVAKTNNDQDLRSSVVNIYCTVQIGRNVKAITGSGVVIDSRGIVLTNAHVGQFPLLQGSSVSKNLNCFIRTGSPINNTYGVKTLFVSRDWIYQNYRNISQVNFAETGENDIAILQIVDKATGNPVSKQFNYLPLSTDALQKNDTISIASYPADSLASRGINAPLTVQVERLRVSDIFSFTQSTSVDLIETSDSLQAQHGSSGGALLDKSNRLAGIIVTTVSGDSPLFKHARGLSIAHINSVVLKDTGRSLNSYISQSTQTIASQFEHNRLDLIQKLIDGSAQLFFQQ